MEALQSDESPHDIFVQQLIGIIRANTVKPWRASGNPIAEHFANEVESAIERYETLAAEVMTILATDNEDEDEDEAL